MTNRSLADLEGDAPFERRHLGPGPDDQAKMLAALGYDSLDALVDAAVPSGIRVAAELDLPAARSEVDALADLRALAAENQVVTSMIGLGYHGTITPAVVQRNTMRHWSLTRME